MLKGINQWCFPQGTSLEEVFEHSSSAGFDVVELNLNPVGGVGLTMDTTVKEAEAIGKLALKYGLNLQSLSTGLLWESPLSDPDPNVREQGRKVVLKQLELAEILGIDTVLVVPGVVNANTPYEVCYKNSQEEIHKLITTAEQRNVVIGIENVWNKFLLSPLEMAAYVDQFESDCVGVYFDVGNVLPFGYPEQWIRLLGERIRKVHVKDFCTKVGNIDGFVPLLAGDVNWKAVYAALCEVGYDGALTAELSPYKQAPFQLIYDTSRHLDMIIRRASIREER